MTLYFVSITVDALTFKSNSDEVASVKRTTREIYQGANFRDAMNAAKNAHDTAMIGNHTENLTMGEAGELFTGQSLVAGVMYQWEVKCDNF